MSLRAIDLFAGAGGLSCGLEWAGGTVAAAVEVDEVASTTFKLNHPEAEVWVEDVRRLSGKKILASVGPIDIVLGGPMCQGVSQRGPRDPRDQRNFAFWEFIRLVSELQPRFFLMENVPALASDVHNRGLATAIFDELESLGYRIAADVVNAAWLGVPQLRYRCVVMGSREHQPAFPVNVVRGIAGKMSEKEFLTVGQAIMDLPRVGAGGGKDEVAMPGKRGLSGYSRFARGDADRLYNHWSAATDEVNLRRVRCVTEGGNWHDIPAALLPSRFLRVRPSDHTTTYRRLHRDHPAHTITTECGNVTSGAYTHPLQDRAITVREAARLQSFPDRFRFFGPRGAQYRQVGNAVPPLMAKSLIETLVAGTQDSKFTGRLTAEILRRHPDSRLPFTLAPRYMRLFGKDLHDARRQEEIA